MSTGLTSKGVAMVESQSLKLAFLTSNVQQRISTQLAKGLLLKGYAGVSSSALNFLSTLECGVNYASDIARNLGVSRQMVAKLVKELVSLGYLEQRPGEGKQKQIVFTHLGEQLMADARQLLADLDQVLFDLLGKDQVDGLINQLTQIEDLVAESYSE